MKKRYVLFLLITILITVTTIVPTLTLRIRTEGACRNYIASLNIGETLEQFDKNEHQEILRGYKKSGITIASLKEKNLSFDESILKTVSDSGLGIALFVEGKTEKNEYYLDNIENIISKYNVEYICIENEDDEVSVNIPLENLISDYDLTLILKETESQLSNEKTQNYESLIKASEGRLIRCYETKNNPLENIKSKNKVADIGDILCHQVINSVRERNTEFILVNQIISSDNAPHDNALKTQSAIKEFCLELEKSGYENKISEDFSDYTPNRRAVSGSVAFICVMMALAVINILLKLSCAIWDWTALIAGLGALATSFVLPESLLLLYPTVYALIASCFIITLFGYYSKKLKDKLTEMKFVMIMILSLLIALLVSGGILSALLSGYDYHLNNLIFRGVKLTLVFPIAFAFCAFPFIYLEKGFIKKTWCSLKIGSLNKTVKIFASGIQIYHIIIAVIIATAGIVYVLRSGNNSISLAETNFRNTLADIFIARPRTKEFLIGWPCLLVVLLLIKRNSGFVSKWIMFTLSALLFASVTNTFCHVFADFTMSSLRTFNAFLLSLPIMTIVYAVFYAKKTKF